MSIENRRSDDCHRVEPLLDDLVDGQLSAADLRAVEVHLADCQPCAERLASLQDLLARVEALPRSLEPEADLWPGIEPRLAERQLPTPVTGWSSPRRGASRIQYWLRQAAAAVAFMALGGGLSQIVVPAWRGGASGGGAGTSMAVAGDPAFEVRAVDFAVAEADFLRAKEALWSAVYSGRDTVSPATREVVERNLTVIAGAIRELRAALAADPGNQQLEGMLLAQHRTEIDLLRRLAQTIEI